MVLVAPAEGCCLWRHSYAAKLRATEARVRNRSAVYARPLNQELGLINVTSWYSAYSAPTLLRGMLAASPLHAPDPPHIRPSSGEVDYVGLLVGFPAGEMVTTAN